MMTLAAPAVLPAPAVDPVAAARAVNAPVFKAPVFSPELLQQLDVPGPRYTSYPTADKFTEAFGPEQYGEALRQRAAGFPTPLSLYVHIPFCESVCYYCACNKIVTRQHGRAEAYLAALRHEAELQVAQLGRGQCVSQLHFGGGTPTFLSDAELGEVMAFLRESFTLMPAAEVSIEVDPRTVDAGRLRHLKALGFNRLSFGVQDFDPDVQQAVHRVQPFEAVRDLVHSAREIGFDSINVDLIYGLPLQTPASFARTVAQVGGLRPDRIALYGYAHLPARFKPQRRIVSADLPLASDRVGMLTAAIAGFLGFGYVHIGMDHFALPGDPLAVAKREGTLHRNFQGYSTQADCDLIALGVSAIGRVGGVRGVVFSQNAKTLPEYLAALARNELPVVRGMVTTDDDAVRRSVIMAIMCQGKLEFDAIEQAHPVRVGEYFRDELARLEPLQARGLVTISPGGVEVTPLGWYFVRAVAMVFDRHLRADATAERFSRIV